MKIGRPSTRVVVLSFLGLGIAACSGGAKSSGFGGAPDDGADAGNGAGTTRAGDPPPPGSPGFTGGAPDGGGGTTTAICAPSPGNFEVPGNNCDDDGNGKVDDVVTCDASLDVAGDASAFAKALELCQTSTGAGDKSWGVVSAAYTRGYNETAAPAAGQHGILPRFGNTLIPRVGHSMGVLSSGWGREYDGDGTTDPFKGGTQMTGPGSAPAGFPKAAAGCDVASDVHDVAEIKLKIKVPDNALGVQLDFNFFSGEWPEYVCSNFNDGFIAYLTSSAFNGGKPDNISFDAKKNPVSVNNGFFDRCTPNTLIACDSTSKAFAGQKSSCPGGDAELAGTGFDDRGTYCTDIFGNGSESTGGGATGWLTSHAPVKPGEIITLELVIWDTGDSAFDSSVLLDHLTWLPTPTETGTGRPPPVR